MTREPAGETAIERRFAYLHGFASGPLAAVDDDHGLLASVERIAEEAERFLVGPGRR